MSQTITAKDLIRRSLILIQAVGQGEDFEIEQYNDGLISLNEMLDNWSLDNMIVYGSMNQSFDTVPGQDVYTIGPTGDFNTTRPVDVDGATCVRLGVSTGIRVISQAEYDRIPIKALAQPLIERLLYVNEYPLGKITIHPVPTEVVTLNLRMNRILSNITDLQQVIDLPPGYLKALRFNLGVDLWPEYPNTTTDIATIKKIAATSLGDIQRSNSVDNVSTFTDVPGVTSNGGASSKAWMEG